MTPSNRKMVRTLLRHARHNIAAGRTAEADRSMAEAERFLNVDDAAPKVHGRHLVASDTYCGLTVQRGSVPTEFEANFPRRVLPTNATVCNNEVTCARCYRIAHQWH